MSWVRCRWLPLVVLIAAAAALIASIAGIASSSSRWETGPMMTVGAEGGGPVRSLASAEAAAQSFAQRWELDVGEVMQFDNGFYAMLLDAAGTPATEVLVEARSGAVQLEWGPAMMWNTAYGMHPVWGTNEGTVSREQARRLADQWLGTHRPGERADNAEAFPGYYTLHTLRGDKIVGMLSVHANTGSVWHHTWHGRFIRMREVADTG